MTETYVVVVENKTLTPRGMTLRELGRWILNDASEALPEDVWDRLCLASVVRERDDLPVVSSSNMDRFLPMSYAYCLGIGKEDGMRKWAEVQLARRCGGG